MVEWILAWWAWTWECNRRCKSLVAGVEIAFARFCQLPRDTHARNICFQNIIRLFVCEPYSVLVLIGNTHVVLLAREHGWTRVPKRHGKTLSCRLEFCPWRGTVQMIQSREGSKSEHRSTSLAQRNHRHHQHQVQQVKVEMHSVLSGCIESNANGCCVGCLY